MPKNLLVEDTKPTGGLVENIKSKMVDLGNIADAVWQGGTMTYRNHTLYRSNDYYRGGKTSSSDIGETSVRPKILSLEDL